MNIRPKLQISLPTAQLIMDKVAPGRTVAAVVHLHGGEIAAVYEIAFADAEHRPMVLKVYPDSLHWKMQKEVTVVGLIADRLSVTAPRILFADDTKQLLGLNFLVMAKLDGSIPGPAGEHLEFGAAAFRLRADWPVAARVPPHSHGSVRLYRAERHMDCPFDKSRLPDRPIRAEARAIRGKRRIGGHCTKGCRIRRRPRTTTRCL
ncbi:phosphotransferase [Tardiphaga sp. 768_D3_N2_1]|uniref:phosphotransferase n=1 Tax=Tardiphaga sp. 768_D3_N2_1 TaxID=3240783 RepID=UPI003F89214C